MGKKYAIAALVTMMIGSVYILYSSFIVQKNNNPSSSVVTEVNSTTTEPEAEVKIADGKQVAEKKVVPTSTNISTTITLGDDINLYGLIFKQPLNFTLERESNVSEDPGYVFLSSDFLKAIPAESEVGANYNGLKKGTRINVTNHTAQVVSSLATPEAYQTFQFDLSKDCSNCKNVKKVTIAGIPALFMTTAADDYGGSAGYTGYYNGRIFSVGIEFADNYAAHEEDLNTFVAGIKFSNE